MILVVAAVVVALASVAYKLGVFDRANFEYHQYLMENKKEMFALVKTSTSKKIGQEISRLLHETKSAIDVLDEAANLHKGAAINYSGPKAVQHLAIGLFFDDPGQVSEPRWAAGWVLDATDFAHAQSLAESASKTSNVPIRAVRVGSGPVIRGRIAWRHNLTPLLGAALNWPKAFAKYEKDGHAEKDLSDDQRAVACALYMSDDKKRGPGFIDYVVLMGNTKSVWSDTFPSSTSTK